MPTELLTSAQEVADFLRIHINTLRRLVAEYPPKDADVFHKLNGRWSIRTDEILKWHGWVKRQQMRHPETRRFRPEEPPEVAAIRARTPRKPRDETTRQDTTSTPEAHSEHTADTPDPTNE